MTGLRAFFAASVLLAGPGHSAASGNICTAAARNAALQTGVPENLLVAITITETRQSGSAWPWSINRSGEGNWYPDRPAAEVAARSFVDAGDSIDVGCFQLNTRWHGHAFASVEAMLDPDANALHAAGFLRDLYAETGGWAAAVAAYHSRDPDRGEAYLLRVGEVLASLSSGLPNAMIDPTPVSRANGFPLLSGGLPGASGSIVPRLAGGIPLVGAP